MKRQSLQICHLFRRVKRQTSTRRFQTSLQARKGCGIVGVSLIAPVLSGGSQTDPRLPLDLLQPKRAGRKRKDHQEADEWQQPGLEEEVPLAPDACSAAPDVVDEDHECALEVDAAGHDAPKDSVAAMMSSPRDAAETDSDQEFGAPGPAP